MTGIAEKLLSQCPVVVTGLLILARAIFESLGLPAPTVVEILAATHVSRSTAYETHDVLVDLLPTLIRARGRPAKSPPTATDQSAAVTRAVLGYVLPTTASSAPARVAVAATRTAAAGSSKRCGVATRVPSRGCRVLSAAENDHCFRSRPWHHGRALQSSEGRCGQWKGGPCDHGQRIVFFCVSAVALAIGVSCHDRGRAVKAHEGTTSPAPTSSSGGGTAPLRAEGNIAVAWTTAAQNQRPQVLCFFVAEGDLRVAIGSKGSGHA